SSSPRRMTSTLAPDLPADLGRADSFRSGARQAFVSAPSSPKHPALFIGGLAYRLGRLKVSRHELGGTMPDAPTPDLLIESHGPAVGLGASIAISCDLVLVAESAWLSDTHVSVGLVAGDGGAAIWPLMTSLLKAKEYLLTGDRIPAAAAVDLGLANRVVADDQLMKEAMAL